MVKQQILMEEVIYYGDLYILEKMNIEYIQDI